MTKLTLIAAAAAVLAVGAPAFAQMQNGSTTTPPASGDQNSMSSQGSMSSDKKMKMSDADMKKWQECQAMTNDMMMKDKKCMSLKKKNDMMGK